MIPNIPPGELMVMAMSEAGYPPTRRYVSNGIECAEWLPPPPPAVWNKAREVTRQEEHMFAWRPLPRGCAGVAIRTDDIPGDL